MLSVSRTGLTAGFIGLLLLLGAVDYALTRDRIVLPATNPTDGIIVQEEQDVSSEPTTEEIVTVDQALDQLGFTVQNSREDNVLKEIMPAERTVEMRVLLTGDDRVTFIAWTEGDDVKTYFTALKEALQSSFSPQVSNLIDRTDTLPDGGDRNVLGFNDPGIHEERMVFVREGNRLLEFHIAPGREGQIETVIEALTQ